MYRKYNKPKRDMNTYIKNIKSNKIIVTTIIITTLLILFNRISIVARVVDIVIFAVLLFITLKFTILSISRINVIGLSSDLKLWSLKILSIVLSIIGFILFSIGFVISYALSIYEVENTVFSIQIIWIAGLCVFVIGLFCNFRTNRRYDQTFFMR